MSDITETTYTLDDLKAAEAFGFEKGYKLGYRSQAVVDMYDKGYTDGLERGEQAGYERGLRAAVRRDNNAEYKRGYEAGKKVTYRELTKGRGEWG